MKINYLIMFFLATLSSCKAQTFNIDNDNIRTISGAYYKDIDNQLNKYVGDWLYTNGSTSLKIQIRKEIHFLNSTGNFYEDVLYGEYQYVESGNTIVNTLPLLTNNSVVIYDHNLNGNYLLKHFYKPLCAECDNAIKRVEIYFTDPEREYLNTACYIGIKQSLNPSDTPQMIFDLQKRTSVIPEDNSPTQTRVPSGTYVLTKQP